MAANIERLAREMAEKYPEVADLLNNVAAVARRLNVPEELEGFSLQQSLATSGANRIEVVCPLSAETQRLVEHMKKDGYAVYDLAGKTPAILKAEGMPFWYVNPALENVSVTPALVAFRTKPSELFLEGSQSNPFERQLELLEAEKVRVEKRYPNAGLIVRVGKPSEWSEAAFEHFKATNGKVRIFGKDYGCSYTWTNAYESDQLGARRAVVGGWQAIGLFVLFDHPGNVSSSLGLATLIEIPRK